MNFEKTIVCAFSHEMPGKGLSIPGEAHAELGISQPQLKK